MARSLSLNLSEDKMLTSKQTILKPLLESEDGVEETFEPLRHA